MNDTADLKRVNSYSPGTRWMLLQTVGETSQTGNQPGVWANTPPIHNILPTECTGDWYRPETPMTVNPPRHNRLGSRRVLPTQQTYNHPLTLSTRREAMPLRMTSVKPGVPAWDMADNHLAIVVAAPDAADVGLLVERRGDRLFVVGEYQEFDEPFDRGDDPLRVEILKDGAELTVENNE